VLLGAAEHRRLPATMSASPSSGSRSGSPTRRWQAQRRSRTRSTTSA